MNTGWREGESLPSGEEVELAICGPGGAGGPEGVFGGGEDAECETVGRAAGEEGAEAWEGDEVDAYT